MDLGLREGCNRYGRESRTRPAAAQALIAEGANVVICARGADALEQADQILAGVRAVRGPERRWRWPTCRPKLACESSIDAALKDFGGIDMLVNNVGLAQGADIEATTDADGRKRSIRRSFRRFACLAARGAAHAQQRRRRDRDHRRRSSAANPAAA